MAQDIVGSLFGVSQQPDYYDQDQRMAMNLANISDPRAMGRYYGAMVGAPLGRALGQGVGSLLGVEDPRLKQQKVIASARQMGFDVTTPEGLQQLASYFVQQGEPGLANQVAQQAQNMSKASAEEGLIEAKTQAALKEKIPAKMQELLAAGYTLEEAQVKLRQWLGGLIEAAPKGSGSSTNVTIDAGSLAKAMGVDVGKQAAGIEGKYSAIDSIKEAQAKLKSGIYSGAYGPEQMAAAKYSLGAVGSKQRVANTEEYMAYIGNVVIPRLSEFGGSDSNEELAYLRRVMAGEQRLEPKAQERILQSALTKIQRGIERVQAQTKAAGIKGEPPLGPGASRETEAKKQRKVFNPQTGKIEVQ